MSLPILSRRSSSASLALACLALAPSGPVAAQVEVTIQGGVHSSRASAPAQALAKAAARPAGGAIAGEATTAGARLGLGLSERWLVDGGLAWSRSSSRDGAVGQPLPAPGTRTIFVSSTVQTRLTDPGARLLLVGGIGPALIFERRDGRSAGQTNVGGLATLAGVLRLDTRLSIRLDAQQYLFSAAITDSYLPHLGSTPVSRSGARLRHDFVLLAGVSWRAD